MSLLSRITDLTKVPKLLYSITNGYKTILGLLISVVAAYFQLSGGADHVTAGDAIKQIVDQLISWGVNPLLDAGEVITIVGVIDKIRKKFFASGG